MKIEEKIVNTQKLNLLIGGGSIKSVRLFRGGSQKCTFVDKVEGGIARKCSKMCVRLLLMAYETIEYNFVISKYYHTNPFSENF